MSIFWSGRNFEFASKVAFFVSRSHTGNTGLDVLLYLQIVRSDGEIYVVTDLVFERKLWDHFPIDGQGKPTTYLSYRILKLLFSTPQRSYTSRQLAEMFAADPKEVDVICRQLHLADLVVENPGENKSYRYKLDSKNVDVQAGFEKFIVDVEHDNLPVHLMLVYSLSTRA